MSTGIITLIVVSLLATAYLTWKLKTGGLIDSILKDPKYAGPNAIGGIMMFIGYIGLSLGLISLPFIPGVRSIPRYLPVYRLIWRDYYRKADRR